MFREVRLKHPTLGFTLFGVDLSFPAKMAIGILCLLLLCLFCTLLYFSNFIILYTLFLLAGISLFKPNYPLYILALILPFFGNNPGGKYSLFFIDQVLILILLRWMIPLVILKTKRGKTIAPAMGYSFEKAVPASYAIWIWMFLFVTLISLFPLRHELWKFYLTIGSLKWFVYSTYTAYAVYFNWCIRLTLDLFLSILFFYYIAYNVREKRQLQNLGLCAFSGLFIAVLLGILDFHNLIDLTFIRPMNRDIQRFGYNRLMSLFWHSGWFAEYLVILSPFFMAPLILGRTNPIKNKKGLFYLILTLLLFYAVVFTYQRAGWISFASSTVVLFVLGRRKLSRVFFRRRNLALFLIILFLVGAGFTFFISSDLTAQVPLARRMRNIFFAEDRTRIWDQALLLFRKKPFLGIGAGNYYAYHRSIFPPGHAYYYTDKVTAHSTYLHILVERGPFGLLTFLILLVVAFRRTWRAYRRLSESSEEKSDHFQRILTAATLASLTGIAVYGLAQYLFYLRIIGLMVWFVLGLSLVTGDWRRWEKGECYPEEEQRPTKAIPGRRQMLSVVGFIIFLLIILALNPTSRDHFFWNQCVAQGEKFLGAWFDPWDEFRISCRKEALESRFMCLNPDISQKAVRVDMVVNGEILASKYCRDKKPHRIAALLPHDLEHPLKVRFLTDRYYRVCEAFPELPHNRKRFHCIVARKMKCRNLGLKGIGFSRWETLVSPPFSRFRWTVSPTALCDVKVSSALLKIQFAAQNPDLEQRPLSVRVTIREKEGVKPVHSRDIIFKGASEKGVSKTLDFPMGDYVGQEVRLEIAVDHTFCPLDHGGEDSRVLGIYVSEPYFCSGDSARKAK